MNAKAHILGKDGAARACAAWRWSCAQRKSGPLSFWRSIRKQERRRSRRTTPQLRNAQHGGSVLELALFMPWILFLFVGVVDLGFFSYALISVESAARVAAYYTSASGATAGDSGGACTVVLNELKALPNIGTSVTSCSGSPLTVSASAARGPDGASASVVSVSYQSLALIPIPGVLSPQFTWTRSVKMRLRG